VAASAPAGLELRLLSAVRAEHAPVAGPIAVIRPGRVITRARLAAALALAGGLIAVLAAQLSGPATIRPAGPSRVVATAGTATRLEDDVELWLSLKTPDSLQSVSDSLDMLSVDTTLLRGTSLDTDLGTLLDPGTM
jgi:hypothetical protein